MIAVCALWVVGCGTTKWSDTTRTGTEQLLISNAIDSAVGKIDFSPIGDKRIFLKTDAINESIDSKYLTMALRQHMAANGGVICDKEDDADYIVEIRVGAIGTDRDDMLIGVPALTFPSIPGSGISASTIPEIPVIKRTKQRGVAKIALFAYNKHTGRPVWASGNNQSESQARNLWFVGTGPLTRGTIYNETTFAGHHVPEFFENKNDRRLKSFADRAVVFRELPNEPTLKNKTSQPNQSDKIENMEQNMSQNMNQKISQTNRAIVSTTEIPRYSDAATVVSPVLPNISPPISSPPIFPPIYQSSVPTAPNQ
jgi:hypothetical protein